jgi:hypothetical protein
LRVFYCDNNPLPFFDLRRWKKYWDSL